MISGSLNDCFKKGTEKFRVKLTKVFLSDGTEIDDDNVLMSHPEGSILHLLSGPVIRSVSTNFSLPLYKNFCSH